MKLVAFGDSFVEGLIKEPVENTPEERSEISFVNRIKDYSKFITTSQNMGLRGNANQKIAYDCYSWLKLCTENNIFVVVAFSGLDRQAHYYRDTDAYHCCETNLHADEQGYFIKDALVLLLHEVMKQKNIPHLFVESFVKYVPEQIYYPKGIPYESTPLSDLSKSLAGCLHPTEVGHHNIAKYLSKRIDEIIIKKSS